MATSIRKLQAVAWVIQPGGVVKDIKGYVFSTTPPSGTVKTIGGYVFSAPPSAVPTLSGPQALLALINQSTTKTFVAADLNFGTPAVLTGQPTNTKVNVSANGSSGYSGNVDVFYNRRSLASIFTSTQFLITPPASNTTIGALLASINSAYSVTLSLADIVDGPVAAGATRITLTASAGSYLYTGSVLLMNVFALSSAVANVNLSGFDNASGIGPIKATVMLMHFDGVQGATTFTDQQGHAFSIASGAPRLNTSPTKFGNTAFNANGGSISTPAAPELQLASDYTIEFFSNQPSVTGDVFPLWASTSNQSMVGGMFFSGSSISVGTTATTDAVDAPSGTLKAGVWQHIALVQHGTTLTLFVDGVAVGTATTIANRAFGTGAWRIGCGGDGSGVILGSIDEFRVSKIARYTANFTPPTAPFVAD